MDIKELKKLIISCRAFDPYVKFSKSHCDKALPDNWRDDFNLVMHAGLTHEPAAGFEGHIFFSEHVKKGSLYLLKKPGPLYQPALSFEYNAKDSYFKGLCQ